MHVDAAEPWNCQKLGLENFRRCHRDDDVQRHGANPLDVFRPVYRAGGYDWHSHPPSERFNRTTAQSGLYETRTLTQDAPQPVESLHAAQSLPDRLVEGSVDSDSANLEFVARYSAKKVSKKQMT